MNDQTEFDGFTIGLKPFVDETLFSWCSRYHRLSAHGLDRITCRQLFGHHQIGAAHDFPARIGALASRAGETLGTATEIIYQRTLLPYYLPFRSTQLAARAEHAMLGQGIGHLKYRLGLLTSGIGAAHPLKACPQCIVDDINEYGWAYWHRCHQLPGVWTCHRHHVGLNISPQKLNQLARFAWVLPTINNVAPVAPLVRLDPNSNEFVWLTKLALMCNEILSIKAGDFADSTCVANTFRNRLTEKEMANQRGRIRWSLVESVLTQVSEKLAYLPELTHQTDSEYLRNQLQAILTGRTLTHPLRYLVWISVFFDGIPDFERSYASTVSQDLSDPHVVQDVSELHTLDSSRQVLIQQVLDSKMSVFQAAKLAHVNYLTMAVCISRQGGELQTRPKKLKADIRTKVESALRAGHDKAQIAEEFDISITSVTRVLLTTPGLQYEWHEEKYKQRGHIARQTWSDILQRYSFLGIKILRKLEPAAYAWLYRNDRDWLNNCLVNVPTRVLTNHAEKRIEKTDQRIADTVRRIAAQNVNQVWTLSELKRAIPSLRKVIINPGQWPCASQALRQILQLVKLKR